MHERPGHSRQHGPSRRPLQFGLRSLIGLTTALAVVFGLLRWLEVSPKVSALILAVLVVGGLATVALVAAIAGSDGEEG